MCMQWRIPSRTGRVSWTQHLKQTHAQRFLHLTILHWSLANLTSVSIVNFSVIIVSYHIVSLYHQPRPRHLQNIFSWISVQFQQRVGLPIVPPDLPSSSAHMHSTETLKGFQLQTSHDGTSYQTRIRKNRWRNITWNIKMWQCDNGSCAKQKLQKHCGFTT